MTTRAKLASHYFKNVVQGTVTVCCLALLLASCQQRESKVEAAKDNVINATQDLKEAFTSKKGGVLIEGLYPNGMRAYYGIGL